MAIKQPSWRLSIRWQIGWLWLAAIAGLVMWSALCGLKFGLLFHADSWQANPTHWLTLAGLIAAWLGGMALTLFFPLYFQRRARRKMTVADLTKSWRTLPGFTYECPACGWSADKPGVCPKDKIALTEFDQVEDRHFEQL